MNNDIVYILKNDLDDEELIYSIRSVCANFEFGSIWFAGGHSENIIPDHHIHVNQKGQNKWYKVRNTLEIICNNKEISNDFWLFNDDFFIMKPLTSSLPPLIDGTILKRIKELNKKYPLKNSGYVQQLSITKLCLHTQEFDTLNYALHVPMLINKKKALETLKLFPNCPMFRSLYGNHHKIGGTIINDVKIYDLDQKPTGEEYLLSTTNESFHNGRHTQIYCEKVVTRLNAVLTKNKNKSFKDIQNALCDELASIKIDLFTGIITVND